MKYEKYKKCDCGWLSEIPTGWTTIPIKRTVKNVLTSFIDGDWIESNVITSDGIRYLTTGNVGALEYKEQGNGYISEETFITLNCTEVYPGDLLISRLNEPIGRTCIVPDLNNRIVVAVDNVIYRPDRDKYDKRYLMYQMNCLPYTENANFIARGSTMSRISRTMLGAIKLCIPPLSEQQAIANYLDAKCAKINGSIDVQKRKIELLNELKQTIITDAVTKGLNPHAPMKNSGVEWIGQVPEHWEVMRLKRCALIKTGCTPPTSESKYYDSEDIDWFTPADIVGSEIREAEKKISYVAYKDGVCRIFPKNSIYFVGIGSIGKVSYCEISASSNQQINVITPNKRANYKYLTYVLKSQKDEIALTANSVTLPIINQDRTGSLLCPLPPLLEQQSIVAHIESETSKIDAQIAKANRRIELLNELKQSIITEAVTGKIKVC
jgi:type I restriction enzyme S subunit